MSSSTGQSQFSAAASDETCATGELLPMPDLKIYTYADLKSATSNFKATTVLGVGGFGTVYKGWVDEKTLEPTKFGTGMIVAIKKLNPESMQGFQEWQVLTCARTHIHKYIYTYMYVYILQLHCLIL